MPPRATGEFHEIGNEVTKDRVVLRSLGIAPGQVLEYPQLRLKTPGPDRLLRISSKKALTDASDAATALLYRRPGYSGQDRLFFDLVAYCPGLNTGPADIDAVLEAEAFPDPASKRGRINPAARALIDKARRAGWQAVTFPAEGGGPGLTVVFDGQGRHAWQRTLPPGIRERVVCDGTHILHLYPQLGLAARRPVSRFHREDFAALVPWAVPPADDLARGADLKLVDAHTVAVVPTGAEALKDRKGRPVPYLALRLVFAEDGKLAERRLVRMPKGEVLLRQVCEPGGTVRLLDGKGKELAAREAKLSEPVEPDLTPDTKGLVVLPLPYRTREHLLQARKLQGVPYPNMRFADAIALLAADVAAGNAEAANVFRQALHAREQRQLGLYVLLAAAGQSLDAQGLDVLGEHPDEPLAQYLALHSSPVLRKHASQWAVASAQWGAGWLRHLAQTHALLQRWQDERLSKRPAAALRAERQRALRYVRDNKESAFGWALLALMEDRAGKDAAVHAELAEAFAWFEGRPGLGYAARYERARCLLKAGQKAEARRAFSALYEQTFKDGVLPPVDGDFRMALLGGEGTADGWTELLQKTAARLVKDGHRPAVLALASQSWQLDDPTLAGQLVSAALGGAPDKQRAPLTLAAVGFFRQTGQLPQADELLRNLLADEKLARRPALWRLAADIAQKRDMTARSLECLERALDAGYRRLPAVIDLQQVRSDYGKLLGHYQALTDAMQSLKVRPPAGFLARVVRAADRWRALDREQGPACQAAARILRALGDPELGWDYLTTPVGLKPNEAGPWAELAQGLRRTGDLFLADRALKAAAEAEPTDADLLWERAQNLRQAGRLPEARSVLRQIADGRWQPRFLPTQARARALLAEP
jgi:tetratricopeptide (TPR) repeat protein